MPLVAMIDEMLTQSPPVRRSDIMNMDLRSFQRNFRRAREAADRGETIAIEGREGRYLFVRETVPAEDRPFADLEAIFGAVKLLPRKGASSHEVIRQRLKTRRAG
jgi:hypothetical protein